MCSPMLNHFNTQSNTYRNRKQSFHPLNTIARKIPANIGCLLEMTGKLQAALFLFTYIISILSIIVELVILICITKS